jgi:transposase
MKGKKAVKKRRSYDAVFKSNILRMNAEGRSVSSLSESFGINENLIYRWKKLASESSQEVQTEDSKELSALRKEVKQLREERDILKKALNIFSRHP